jgi:hypothetical protein
MLLQCPAAAELLPARQRHKKLTNPALARRFNAQRYGWLLPICWE